MEKIAAGVYSIRIQHVRMFIVDGDEGVTLIDSGIPGKEGRILEALGSVGRSAAEIRSIMLTHSHSDHSGTAAALKQASEAKVFVSATDAPAVRGDEPAPPPPVAFRFPFLKPLMRFVPAAPGVDVDRLVSEGMRLPGELIAYETPGHTEGHVSYVLNRGPGVLFVGDAARNKKGAIVRGYFNAPTTTIDASIRRLGALHFDIACFGHSPAIASGARAAFRAFS